MFLFSLVQCAKVDPYMPQCEACSGPKCPDSGVRAVQCTPGFILRDGMCTTPSVRLACALHLCDVRIVKVGVRAATNGVLQLLGKPLLLSWCAVP